MAIHKVVGSLRGIRSSTSQKVPIPVAFESTLDSAFGQAAAGLRRTLWHAFLAGRVIPVGRPRYRPGHYSKSQISTNLVGVASRGAWGPHLQWLDHFWNLGLDMMLQCQMAAASPKTNHAASQTSML